MEIEMITKETKLTKENSRDFLLSDDSYEAAKLDYWLSKLPHYIVEDEDDEDV